jgi:peroxiredoxin
MSDFEAEDTEVFVIVPHERCRVKWWAERSKDSVVMLADPGFLVSSKYGVAFQMQIHTDISNTPGTFLIDKQGVLQWSHIGTGKKNWRDRPTATQTLERVKELSK